MGDQKLDSSPLVIEEVAGRRGSDGDADGALTACQFAWQSALCSYDDLLIVADTSNEAIRLVEGVLGLEEPVDGDARSPEFEARVLPLIMTALSQVLTELARLIAQHAQPRGRTQLPTGRVNHLLRAEFSLPTCVAVDTTDAVAGPQLLIGQENGSLRALNLRTHMVTTIAAVFSKSITAFADGPALSAGLRALRGMARSGVLYVLDTNCGRVPRISAAKYAAGTGRGSDRTGIPVPAERFVTTLIGPDGDGVRFARSSVRAFQDEVMSPMAMAYASDSASDCDPDRDAQATWRGPARRFFRRIGCDRGRDTAVRCDACRSVRIRYADRRCDATVDSAAGARAGTSRPRHDGRQNFRKARIRPRRSH
jgi:hypothetical protein